MAKTKNALEILKRRRAKDSELQKLYEEETINLKVATLIRKTREEAGLTQEGLAQKIETTQSVISRLEDADYEGHSLTMLDKIARVLNKRLDIDMDSKQSESSRVSYMEILTMLNVHVSVSSELCKWNFCSRRNPFATEDDELIQRRLPIPDRKGPSL